LTDDGKAEGTFVRVWHKITWQASSDAKGSVYDDCSLSHPKITAALLWPFCSSVVYAGLVFTEPGVLNQCCLAWLPFSGTAPYECSCPASQACPGCGALSSCKPGALQTEMQGQDWDTCSLAERC